MTLRSQPSDDFHQIILRHCGAAGGRSVHAPPNMEKNGASRSGHRGIGIVPNLDQPVVGKIARAHFLVTVIVRRLLRIDHDVPVVIRRTRIVTPDVCISDLMIRIICAGREVRFVSKNFADFENSRRRAAVPFFLAKSRLVLPRQSDSPGQTAFAKQYWKGPRYHLPVTAARTLKQTQLASHRIPCGRDSKNELRAVIRHAICTSITGQPEQREKR